MRRQPPDSQSQAAATEGRMKTQALWQCPRAFQKGRKSCQEQAGVGPLLVKLQLQAEERGVVSIKGVCANRYLAMKEDGRLLASKCVTEECFFFERLESNNYNTYRSRKYSGWYVALKRTGQYKLGSKTGPGQKAILFLPMSAKS
uniref:fibroblast growth factor 2 n=1 Tax=Myodes glareolus TaxID=447135 RepID=UPI0020225AAF|nr:fibroblast growth factor 2 [Myodes glareolus]